MLMSSFDHTDEADPSARIYLPHLCNTGQLALLLIASTS
jgi:hypothetical protein